MILQYHSLATTGKKGKYPHVRSKKNMFKIVKGCNLAQTMFFLNLTRYFNYLNLT